ncbi:MAG: sigma-70 family RNA polymerase sigma factor [Myxococcales bacterium]|nr:sigma-70 family RNA polymerase sigma factor [Myxococcales bacterium]
MEQTVRKFVDTGDAGAFRQIVDATQSRVYRMALRTAGSAQDAEEIVQETYVRAWRDMKRFDFRSSIATWLCRIAYHVAIDHVRREARNRKRIEPEREELAPLVERIESPNPGPEDELGDRRLQQAVQRLLDTLKPKYRAILTLREIDGLSYDEIADELGIAKGTVESRLFRARAALMKKVKVYLGDLG